MKKIFFALVMLYLSLLDFPAEANTPGEGRLGAGLMVGTLISFTGKYWLSQNGALDFGFGFVSGPWTILYADYLWHFPGLFGSGTKFGRQTSGYVGGGGGLGFWNNAYACGHWECSSRASGTGFFIRGLFGAEWFPVKPPLGVFMEFGPSVVLAPGVGGTVDFGLGVRYYF